jgi:DNA polymerase
VWEIDQAINQCGIAIDLPLVRAARSLCLRAAGPLVREFAEITGGLKPSQGAKFLAWLGSRGVDLPNLQKATVAAILGEEDDDTGEENEFELVDLPGDARRALHIRSLVSSASIKKLDRMAACVGFDGRARGLLQYHAASPGRWAGRILQPQNFPRGTVKGDPEAKVSAILRGEPDTIRDQFGCDPIELVVSSLRHALVAKPGNVFVAGDYAGIEARMVLALAGQHDKTALMSSGVDVYCDMASQIFERTVTKEADPEARQTG